MNEPYEPRTVAGNWFAIPFALLGVALVIGVLWVIYLTNFAEPPEGITPPLEDEPTSVRGH
jgi:hypothetical protein